MSDNKGKKGASQGKGKGEKKVENSSEINREKGAEKKPFEKENVSHSSKQEEE